MDIILTEPVQAHGETLDTLQLREPTIGDLMDLPVSEKMKLETAELAAKLANVPPSVIKNMNYKDGLAVAKYVNPFLLEYLTTWAPS